jgi:hypothetical protein
MSFILSLHSLDITLTVCTHTPVIHTLLSFFIPNFIHDGDSALTDALQNAMRHAWLLSELGPISGVT